MRIGIRLLLCLQLVALLLCMVSAASVTGQEVTVEAGKKIEIPVYITNNEGIMGFRITVDYPAELLCEPKIRAGSLTESGLLDSNTSQEGRIEVLWCASADARGEGSLFVLEFTVRDGMQGVSGELLFSYTQEDTFNEKWEDVPLQFSPVLVRVAGSSAATTEVTDATTTRGETSEPTEGTTASQTEETASTELSLEESSTEASSSSMESSTEASSSSTELSTEPNREQEETPVPVLPIVLIAVVILGSMFGIYWIRRRK